VAEPRDTPMKSPPAFSGGFNSRDIGVSGPVQFRGRTLYANSWALLIGINDYSQPGIPQLQYSENDARAMAELLPSLGFPPENICLLLSGSDHVTRESINRIIEHELNPRMSPDDRLVVHFSGHGVNLRQGEREAGYLLLPDSKLHCDFPSPQSPFLSRMPADALDMRVFLRQLDSLPAKHKILFIDSCHSGFMARARSVENIRASDPRLDLWCQEQVTQVITAGRSGQRAFEDPRYQHGQFSWFLLKGLMGHADPRGDGLITGQDLYGFVRDRVAAQTDNPARRQDPQFWSDGEGQFVFLRSPSADSDAPADIVLKTVPGDVRSADGEPGLTILPAYRERIVTDDDATAFYHHGISRHEKGDLEGAIKFYTEAIRLKPNYADAFSRRGAARHAKGDFEGAIKDCTEAIRLKPDYADAFYNRGTARHDKGDFEGAIKDCTEAIRLKPDYADAFYNRGTARYAKGNFEEAIKDYTEAIRLKPIADAFYNRGDAQNSKGDFEEAIKDYTEAIRLKPEYSRAFERRGYARQTKGDVEGAIRDFTEAIRLKPDSANAFLNRGIARKAKGDLHGADEDFEQRKRLIKRRPSGKDLVVSKSGQGFRTIGEAVRVASEGQRILVRPGVYREGIILDHDVEIIGDGPMDQCVIETEDAACVLVNAGRVVIQNLSLRCFWTRVPQHEAGRAFPSRNYYGVAVTGNSEVTIEDCDVTSDLFPCIGYDGPGEYCIRRTKVHGSRHCGMIITNSFNSGIIEDCEIFDNAKAGVELLYFSKSQISRTRIHHNNEGVVAKMSVVKIEDCQIFANTIGLDISCARTTIQNSKIYGGRVAIWLYRDGKTNPMTVEDCEIFETNNGIVIELEGSAIVRRTRLHDARGSAVSVKTGSSCSIEDSQIFDNDGTGIEVDSSTLVARRCDVRGNSGPAISLVNSKGSVESSRLLNRGGSWFIRNSSVRKANNEEMVVK
jgi:tetratricopeptide (TPR) repeat protein